MIDLIKAYAKVKKYISINKDTSIGVYYYSELKEVFAFFVGETKKRCFDNPVIIINKEGGKLSEYDIQVVPSYFYEIQETNLIELNNPDSLDIQIDNPVEDVELILDKNIQDEVTNKDIIYNLVEDDESYRTIEKIIKSGITLENITKMDLIGFSKAYGIKKKELYNKIYNLSKGNIGLNNINIYALYGRGLSNFSCDKLLSLGIDKLYKLSLIPQEIFATKYSTLESFVDKVYEAFDKMKFTVEYNAQVVEWLNILSQDNNYRKYVKSQIHNLISQSEKEIKPFQIKSMLDARFSQLPIINDLIDEMIEDKIISLNEYGLKANTIKLKDYLNYLPDNTYTDLARKYFLDDNSTYESLGEPLNISRERIRQLLKKVQIPLVYEDCYGEYFTKYDFNENSFSKIFNETRNIYKFLLYRFDKKGTIKLESLLDREDIDDKLRQSLEIYFNNKFIFVDGNKLYKNKSKLLEYYMKENVRQLTHVNEIWNGFKEFLNNIIPDTDSLNFDPLESVRDVEAPLSFDSFPSLKSNKHLYKYYDIRSLGMETLLNSMDLGQYKDIEISAKYLFDLHADLMKEYDIDDPYVLHNLLRKLYVREDVNYQRSPYIVFGKGDRNKQFEKLILEYSPIPVTELTQMYCDVYGGHFPTVRSYIESTFKELLNHQTISLDHTDALEGEQVDRFRNLLCSKEMWFKEDIYSLCKEKEIEIPDNLFVWHNIERVGFRNASNYIYSTKYSSMTEFLEKTYFEKDFLDTNSLDRRIMYIVLFSGLIIEKRKNLDIIEYEKGKFMKSSLLNKANVGLDDLRNFIDSVDDFTVNKGPFTIKSIKQEGYYHEIFELGFDDLFYSSILRGSDKFAFKRYGKTMLFENNEKSREVSLSTLLEKILFTYRKIDEYDLLEYLEEVYGLDYRSDHFTIQSYAKETNVYYDKYMNVYYYDYETYYEEM